MLTVIPSYPHSLPTRRADRYAEHPHSTSLRPAVQTDMPDHPHSPPAGCADSYGRSILTTFQPTVLTVMPDPTHFTPTGHADRCAGPPSLPSGGRADSYAGPSSLNSNRPCLQLCRIILPPHLPAVLTVMPDPLHSLPTSGADRYAGPSSLHSNLPS